MATLTLFGHDLSGTTAARQTNVEIGQPYFDTTLGQQMFWDGTAWRPASGIVAEERTFTETAGAGTYTGSITVPAGATVIDVQVHGIALWNAATTASLTVGDVGNATGYYVATDLKAIALLAGEANTFEHPGGLAGAYIAAEQRVLYSATARVISGVIVTTGGAGTAGRTRLVVIYALPNSVAAAKV